MDPLIRTEVSRIQKVEWLMAYVQAREKAFRKENVLGGWRGAGLFPFDPSKVLHHLPSGDQSRTPSSSPSAHIDANLFDQALVSNSSSDADQLRSTNLALNQSLEAERLMKTPQLKYIGRLGKTTERLLAQKAILLRENKELKAVISARRERQKGKRIALKDQLLLTTDEILKAVVAIEEEGRKRKRKGAIRKRKTKFPVSVTAPEDDEDDKL